MSVSIAPRHEILATGSLWPPNRNAMHENPADPNPGNPFFENQGGKVGQGVQGVQAVSFLGLVR